MYRRNMVRRLELLEAEGVRKAQPDIRAIDLIPEARREGRPLPIFIFAGAARKQVDWSGESDWIRRAALGLSHRDLPSSLALTNLPGRQVALDWMLWEMARITGFIWPESLVVDWFCDAVTPSQEVLFILARALDINPNWLIEGRGTRRGNTYARETTNTLRRIDDAIHAYEAIRGLASEDLETRLRGAMIRRGVLRDEEPLSAGFRILTGDPDWITDTQISAGGPEDPERLGTIADRCLVPRAWLMRNERPELSLVGVISRTREVAEIRKLSRQLKTPPKPETGRPGRTSRE